MIADQPCHVPKRPLLAGVDYPGLKPAEKKRAERVPGEERAVAPAADEVSEFEWVEPQSLRNAAAAAPFAFSPWLVWQLDELSALPSL